MPHSVLVFLFWLVVLFYVCCFVLILSWVASLLLELGWVSWIFTPKLPLLMKAACPVWAAGGNALFWGKAWSARRRKVHNSFVLPHNSFRLSWGREACKYWGNKNLKTFASDTCSEKKQKFIYLNIMSLLDVENWLLLISWE